MRSILSAERLFIGGDFNGDIGSTTDGYDEVHGGFDLGDRNGGGTSLLDFAKTFELVIANSSFPKREEYLVTFQSTVAKTRIDYLLLRRYDRRLCKDCKVIPGGTLATHYRFLVINVNIMIKRKKKVMYEDDRGSGGDLEDKAQELKGRLSTMGAWRSSGDASVMWMAAANYIRETEREVLGVSTGYYGWHKGDWCSEMKWSKVQYKRRRRHT